MRPRWEVVLLYLLELGSVEGKEPLEEATQRGISEDLGIPLPHLPRIMSPLIKEGLVTCEKEHVRGRKRRVLIYRLTPRGLNRARDLMKEVMEEFVNVEGRRVRLGEVRVFYPSYQGPLSPLLLGRIPFAQRGKEDKVHAPGEPPSWYVEVRKDLLNLESGSYHIDVAPWEAPYTVGLLLHRGGFELLKAGKGIWHLKKGETRVVVGGAEEQSGYLKLKPPSPSVERWVSAFPHLSEIMKPLHRISGGDIGVLRVLEELEDEVRECMGGRTPQDCALMIYLKYSSSREASTRKLDSPEG